MSAVAPAGGRHTERHNAANRRIRDRMAGGSLGWEMDTMGEDRHPRDETGGRTLTNDIILLITNW